MKIEQIYTGCLAQGAYYVESEGECAVIDPLRDPSAYLKRASQDKATVKYVFETHFHADFISGHLDLARLTGAEIVYGPGARPAFHATIANDGDIFRVGKLTFVVLHTPGHTLESCCYLLRDEQGKDIALFTGDTLFIGDVGRPDLAQKAAHKSKEELAGILYESLRLKILPLADDITVYPAHGAGSACGKNMSAETSDTLGHQKLSNYALDEHLGKEDFINAVLEGLTPPPAYFPSNVKMNRQGYDAMDKVLQRGMHALPPQSFSALADQTGALILDTRDAQLFAKGFIPGSINIGLNGNFAPWAGALIPNSKQELLIVADPGREEEAITRLARVGLDYCFGYLEGGIHAWEDAGFPIDTITSVAPSELPSLLQIAETALLDVRSEKEYEGGHLPGALNVPLSYVTEQMKKVQKSRPEYVYCAGGYRSMIFISILRSRGYRNLVDVRGGFAALQAEGIPELLQEHDGVLDH